MEQELREAFSWTIVLLKALYGGSCAYKKRSSVVFVAFCGVMETASAGTITEGRVLGIIRVISFLIVEIGFTMIRKRRAEIN